MSVSEKEMDDRESGSTVRLEGRGPVVGVIPGTPRPIIHTEDETPVGPAVFDSVVEDPADQPAPRRFAGAGAAVPFLVGGLSGAVMAVITVFLITVFQPPLDPRVVPMAEQLNGFVQQMYNLETNLRSAEVDLVRLIDSDRTRSIRIDKQNEVVAAALSEVSAAREEMRVKSGPGSPVFGVATVQLATAMEAGRPFESEWVNIFALTAGDPVIREFLMPLVSMVRDGVATSGELSEGLRRRAGALDLPFGRSNDILQASMSFLQTQLGIPVGFTANEEVVREVLARVDELLLAGHVDQAMIMFSNLGESTSGKFADWTNVARQRETADRIIANLQKVSRERLSSWARESAKP
jgi:hypothetical protein